MITSKELKNIKKKYISSCFEDVYLCFVARNLNIKYKFKAYLMDNLDETMIHKEFLDDDSLSRWKVKDSDSRIKWLDKHINKLEDYENSRK